jgi:dCMP deaminase
MEVNDKWSEKFMRNAYFWSESSKDVRTKVGAVLVRKRRPIAVGYNGLPEGLEDDLPKRQERPLKYFFFEHAERNCFYQCAHQGVSSSGCTIYTMGTPCADCARAVINCHVVKCVIHKQWVDYEKVFYREKWEESCKISEQMLLEAGVQLEVFDKVLGIKTLMDGKIIEV